MLNHETEKSSGERRWRGIFRRIVMLIIGSALAATGIALTTTSGLGTTPISSLPWALTAVTGYSFGTTTFAVNLLFFAIEAVLLGRRFPKANILQIPAVLVFGVFIDTAMHLAALIAPSNWFAGLAVSLIGNVFLATGIVLQVNSKTLVQPGESAVLAIALCVKKVFGTVKVFFDATLVALAALLAWVMLGHTVGIREGTLISALLVGTLAKIIAKIFARFAKTPTDNP